MAAAAQAPGSGRPVATPTGGGLLCGVDLGNLSSRAWLLTPPPTPGHLCPHLMPQSHATQRVSHSRIWTGPAGLCGRCRSDPTAQAPRPPSIHTVPGWVLLLGARSPLLPASSEGPLGYLLENWELCCLFASVSPVSCGGGLGVPWTPVLAHMEYLLCPWGAGGQQGAGRAQAVGLRGRGPARVSGRQGGCCQSPQAGGEGRGPRGAPDPVTSQPRQLLCGPWPRWSLLSLRQEARWSPAGPRLSLY